ncbi:EAL domain-containing protein [uncultured Endozoicomonas sp.]|uniref:EAL domain-containing response regulator n=1 Tax=uncultured Endozoicomonas sp. TaxID=432652 RepID=UPI0026167DD8|nr:EAL domain-containing protein [uncultured Endozoicomonas sp.]
MESGSTETLRVLMVGAAQEEADACLNALRESGYATRADLVNDPKELSSKISVLPPWDLLITINKPESMGTSQVCDFLSQQNIDLPVIVMLTADDDTDPLSFVKMGARAVIPMDDGDYLTTITAREFDALKARRHHRRMSVALYESEKQRRILLDDQVDPVIYISHGKIQYANAAFSTLLGLSKNERLDGRAFKEFISEKDQKDVEEFLFNVEDSGQAFAAVQCSLSGKDGTEISTRTVISATSYHEQFALSLQIHADSEEEGIKDIPAQVFHRSEETVFDSKHFDQFQQLVDVAVQKAVSGKGKDTLCCIYIDTLKEINAEHGRGVCQRLVAVVAKEIGAFLGDTRPFTNLGGGSFVALLREGEEEKIRRKVTDLLATVTTKDVEVEGKLLQVKLSLGAVIFGETSDDAKTMLSQSRQAAVMAYKQGGNQLCFYQKRRDVKPVHSVEKHLAGLVSQALKNKKLKLTYQPLIPLSGSSLEYYEVSLNIIDGQGREHKGSVFRPKLEKISLWNKVDQWQLIEASKALKAKRKEGNDTRLLVQLGGYAVTDEKFLPWMNVALKAAGIPTSALAVELSETNIARYTDRIGEFFKELKTMGCQTVVRDFGCSVNPLAAIENLDVDLVMLDTSFTRDLDERARLDELRKLITDLTQTGKQVIVPGIESAEDMSPVWQFGANYIGGNFLQPPSERMNFNFDG